MIEAIRRELAMRADPAKAPDMQAYMKSEMPSRCSAISPRSLRARR